MIFNGRLIHPHKVYTTECYRTDTNKVTCNDMHAGFKYLNIAAHHIFVFKCISNAKAPCSLSIVLSPVCSLSFDLSPHQKRHIQSKWAHIIVYFGCFIIDICWSLCVTVAIISIVCCAWFSQGRAFKNKNGIKQTIKYAYTHTHGHTQLKKKNTFANRFASKTL